jgi:photosystem II stability/assembly factor-like uncharacterized protein
MHRRAALRLGSLLLFVFLLTGCGSPPQPLPMTYPFIEVVLEGLPAGVTQVQVDATFNGKSRSETFADNDMLNRVTISLPPDGRGNLEMLVTVRDGNRCLLAMGKSEVMVSANEVRTITVTLSAQTPPLCPTGMMYAVNVQKTGDGRGDIVAMPDSLSCDPACAMKSGMFEAGATISLAATPDPGATGSYSIFEGWSGACTGTGSCFVTVAQAENVTARFSCRGWCPESLPAVTTNLNGIWGFSSNRVIAVGDAGVILQWNGTSWTPVTKLTTNPLRGVHGLNSTYGFAVGDGGIILQTTDGGTGWATSTSATTQGLRSVWIAATNEAYAVGDPRGNNFPWLRWNGTAWADPGQGGFDQAWHSVFGVGPGRYFIVGVGGRTAVGTPDPMAYVVTGNPELRGVFGTSATTMTAVGMSGTIARYDSVGKVWNSMARPGTATPTLRAIHGTANRMYTVGDAGTVWLLEAGVWRAEPTPITTQLNGVFLLSDNEVFVVGQNGLIYHKRP